MRTLFIAVASTTMLAASPALAQDGPAWDDEPYYEEELELPRGAQVEAMAPVLDSMTEAMLELDVGPMLDAVDPLYRHGPRHRRTLGDLARRDDPAFDGRLRDSIYGTTAMMGRMIDAIAAATPAMRRSLREMEREIDRAVRDAGPYRR